jgi:uncharacterized protein
MTDNRAYELINRIKDDMRQAMKDKQRARLNELRSLLALINNAEAITSPADKTNTDNLIAGAAIGVGSTEAPRKQMAFADVQSIILAEIEEIKSTLESLDKASDYAAELREKLSALNKYI